MCVIASIGDTAMERIARGNEMLQKFDRISGTRHALRRLRVVLMCCRRSILLAMVAVTVRNVCRVVASLACTLTHINLW